MKIYSTVILPVVLYGCETWSITLREERRLRVFENRVLRRISGPNEDEITETREDCVWMSFMFCTSHIICMIWVINSRTRIWAGNVERVSDRMDEDRVSVGKPEGKRPQEGYRLRLDVNIEVTFQEVGMIVLAQERDR